jgi:L-alanine-DL-glutamate epimerase-like enolase superfamily enzyme
MWEFFGGAQDQLHTDITIPTGSVGDATEAARRAKQNGFETLKIKVGGSSLNADLERLAAIGNAFPGSALLLDANCAYSAPEALELLAGLGELKSRVTLFEQPTARGDLDAMRKVMVDGQVEVAADESAASPSDVVRIANSGAASAINIKTMKCGLLPALDMVAVARSHGLKLMVGGMVESQLCMSVSACVAGGLGGFDWVDLDTPLFMKQTPWQGGYEQTRDRLRLDHIVQGHGVRYRTPRRAC